jgi:16S rRNA processing protein RimM
LGGVLGTVSALHNFGAGDVIEIARTDNDHIHLPFNRETVPLIEIAKGRIVIAMPQFVEGGDIE